MTEPLQTTHLSEVRRLEAENVELRRENASQGATIRHLQHHDRKATAALDEAAVEKYDSEDRADSTDDSGGSEWSLWKRIGFLRRQRDEWKRRTEPDTSPGDVIAAEPDGTIFLDDGITTWNPSRACAFLVAEAERKAEADRDSLRLENSKLRVKLEEAETHGSLAFLWMQERRSEAEAQLERLRSGIRSEVERLRKISAYHFGSSDRATPGSPAATEYNQRAVEARYNADRLEALLEADK